jgi:serine/threonine-protein kinase
MIGKILSERYELLEKIGEGGMADVYKAEDHLLQRRVAVKILKAQFNEDEDFIEKFDRESKAAAGLTHPNIVNIYDVGQDEDIRYIVMEFIDGVTLKKYMIDKGTPLEETELLKITMQVASALDHAHKNHIVHRDIKPQNILMSKGGVAKVADFGIAKAINTTTIVNSKIMLGTVHYSSPEQSRGSFVDHRTDIYSLGIMMYEMSTGKLPFVGDSAITVALKHMKEEVLPPSQINPEISEGIENIILKALKKSADYRYQTAGEMMVDLTLLKNNPDETIDFNSDDFSNPTQYLPDMEEYEKMSKEKAKNRKKQKPKKRNNMSRLSLVTVVLLALVAAAIVFGVIGFTILKDKFSLQEVEVPNLVNMTFDDARKALNDKGLYIEEDGYRYSNIIENGNIIEQSEEPGELLKEGFTIKVIISKGKNMIIMPNLLQKDITEAEIVMENMELVIGTIDYVANDLPKGYIISQNPSEGAEIEVGQVVNLVISQGNSLDEYLMPSLIGLDFDAALDRFNGKNIYLNVLDYVYSDYEVDLIAAQDIQQGTTIYPGTTINVSLSNGPEPEKEVTKPYKFYTQYFEGETELVTIELVKDDVSTIVYQQEHTKSEDSFIVEVTASGKVTMNIYYGDELFNSFPETFR